MILRPFVSSRVVSVTISCLACATEMHEEKADIKTQAMVPINNGAIPFRIVPPQSINKVKTALFSVRSILCGLERRLKLIIIRLDIKELFPLNFFAISTGGSFFIVSFLILHDNKSR